MQLSEHDLLMLDASGLKKLLSNGSLTSVDSVSQPLARSLSMVVKVSTFGP